MTLIGCGSDQQQIIKYFSYTIEDNHFTFNLEFSQNIEINTEFTIPILDYGSISLIPPINGKGFIIGGSLNLDYINDERIAALSKTQKLPNSQPMSPYVTQELARIKIVESSVIATDAYLGTNSQHLYLGTALELGYIDQHFPAGLVISGRITDAQKRTLGVVSIFGPEVKNGQVVNPGGFFFVTNISDLIAYNPRGANIVPERIDNLDSFNKLVEVNKPYRKVYSDPFKMNDLLQKILRAGREAGYND